MIFYFSGVGNSRWVAQQLSQQLGDQLRFIPDEISTPMSYELRDGECLGFVFPCYGWGVPVFVERFIEQMQVSGGVKYLYFVTTCGDDTGMTAEIFCADAERKGWECKAGWAVVMPESYICLPGFDVDNKEKENEKIMSARDRVNRIIDDITDRRCGFDTIPGPMKWAKSHIVRPVFNRFLITPKHFKTTVACTSCGACVRVCPYSNISILSAQRPVWGDVCVQCMRCYHTCPQHAIEWGRFTRGKGQYLFPQHLFPKKQ